jgi:polyhydroxyalkanoate synthesis regulator phasin
VPKRLAQNPPLPRKTQQNSRKQPLDYQLIMDKLFKKVLYTGIGIFTATTEKLQKAIDDLVQRGRLSEEEGMKVVEDVVKNTENKKEEYEGRFRRLIDAALSKLNLPQGDTHDKLEKRIKSLEVKLGLLTKELEAQKNKGTSTSSTSKKTTGKAKKADAQDSVSDEKI